MGKRVKNKSGQSFVEYVLLLGLFSIVLILALSFSIRQGFKGAFNKYKAVLTGPYDY